MNKFVCIFKQFNKRIITISTMDSGFNRGIKRMTNSKQKSSRLTPSHFISVQITNPEIHERISHIQKEAVSYIKEVENTLEPVTKMHITLDVVKLNDKSSEERAKQALESIVKQVDKEKLLPVLEVQGLNTFYDSVVFASIKPDTGLDQLKRLAEICRYELTNHEVIRTDSRPFNPHITIMKISKKDNKVLKKIPQSCHFRHRVTYFGRQEVRSIQLCAMRCEEESEYYPILTESYFNQPEECSSAGDNSLSMDEKGMADNSTGATL